MIRMPTDGERCEVAARLRDLPVDMPSEMDKWEKGGLFIEPSTYDEADYSQIHNVLLDCFPADHMHPCDYEELHARLADLIEPTVETCEADLTDVIEARVAVREYECSKCGMSWETVWAYDFSYCPYCGRRINHADE